MDSPRGLGPRAKGRFYTSLADPWQLTPISPSQQTPFCEGDRVGSGDDQVVEHPDVDERQRVAQAQRDELVRPTGLGHARGVIVGQDDRCGVMGERLAQYLAGMHARSI